jgi:hypothetical protein
VLPKGWCVILIEILFEKILGRPRHRWEGNIKMDLQEVEWGAWTRSIWIRIGAGGGLL